MQLDAPAATTLRRRVTRMLRFLQVMAAWATALLVAVGVSRLPTRKGWQPPSREVCEQAELSVTYPRLKGLVIGTVFLVFGLWLMVQFATQTLDVLILVTVSVILATALRPAVDRMSSYRWPVIRRSMPRPLAILIIYVVLASILVGVGFLVVPRLITEFQQLIANLPIYATYVGEALANLERYPFVPDLSRLQDQLVGQLVASLSQAINVLLFLIRLVFSLLSFIVVLVITFFVLMDAQPLYDHLLSLFPPPRRGHIRQMTDEMGRKVEGWLKGVFLLSTFIGIGTAVGMWALGMPYPLILGLLAGLFELVPLVGAYLGAAPAVIVALFQPPWKLLAVVAFFILLQQLENNILAPTVMGREAEIPPLLAIVALLLGAALFGIIGALLALPMVAVLQVLWLRLVVPEIRGRNGEED